MMRFLKQKLKAGCAPPPPPPPSVLAEGDVRSAGGRLEFKDRCFSVGQALARSGRPVFPDDPLPAQTPRAYQ